MDNEIYHLKLEEVVPNEYQPREVLDEASLNELTQSIKQHGVIQPIIVRQIGEKYEIVDGLRRYRASILAGLMKIPAIVRNYTENESVRIGLIDNLQRQDFSPIEEARMYKWILEKESMTQEELANNIGKSQSAVANKLRLLNLPMEVQESLLNGEISERHARSLLTVKDARIQIDLLKKVIEKRMTVRELDSEIKNMSNMFIPEQFSNNNFNNENDLYNSPINQEQGSMFIPNNNLVGATNPLMNNNGNDNNQNNYTNNFYNQPLQNNVNGNNPFLTNNNYNPPMQNQNGNNNINPFASIRMNTNNKNSNEVNNNSNLFFTNADQVNNANSAVVSDSTNVSSNSNFNIDDYKLPGFDESYNNSYNDYNVEQQNNNLENNSNINPIDEVNNYKYVEDNPNYVSVDKPQGVESVDDVINMLKNTLGSIKNGKIRIETEEVDYDDSYQITITIDKKGDF